MGDLARLPRRAREAREARRHEREGVQGLHQRQEAGRPSRTEPADGIATAGRGCDADLLYQRQEIRRRTDRRGFRSSTVRSGSKIMISDRCRDRKSVGEGKSVDLGGSRIIKKKKQR